MTEHQRPARPSACWLRAVARAASGRARRGDQGFTLVAVLGLMSVGLLLTTLVTTVAIQSSKTSGSFRGGAQAQAAAEAGVNAGEASLLALNRTTQATFDCTPDATTVYASPGSSSVTSVFRFYTVASSSLSGATAYTCPLTNGTSYKTAVVVSTAVYTSGTIRVTKSMEGVVDLSSSTVVTTTPTTSTSVVTSVGSPTTVTSTSTSAGTPFTQALFSNGDLSLTNKFTTTGDVYTNGNYTCGTSDAVTIGGNLTAAGTGLSEFSNPTCGVTGDTALGGYLKIDGASTLAGALTVAGTTASTVAKAARVQGAAAFRSTVTTSEGTSTAPVFKGGLVQNSSTATAPAALTMPVEQYKASDWSGATFLTAGTWGAQAATKNGAYSWSSAYSTGNCTLDGANYALNGDLYATASSTVVDARSCSPLTLQGVTVEMSGDLTIFASSFTATNGVSFVSKDGAVHSLRIIVPTTASSGVCAAGGGDMSISNSFTTDSTIKTFLYTPGKATISNVLTIYGAVYACTTSLSNTLTINYVTTPLPGGSTATTTTSTVTPTTTTTVTSTSTATSTSTSTAYDASTLGGLADVPNS